MAHVYTILSILGLVFLPYFVGMLLERVLKNASGEKNEIVVTWGIGFCAIAVLGVCIALYGLIYSEFAKSMA